MPEARDYLGNLLGEVSGIAADYVRTGGVRVSVKTNLGPEIPVYSGSGGSGSNLLGIKAGVIVRNRDGGVIATYGDPPATDPIRVAMLVLVVTLLGIALVRGVLPR